jgi:pimeloyl-ACP methyl ester carboxylesterase
MGMTLRRPGADLYYEVRGQGPTVLMIPGASGDGATFDHLAALLAQRYTVVTYDRRGFSRSRLHGPVDPSTRLASDVEDARRLLGLVSAEPAFVLGSCSGAIVALELLTRHPELIRRMIAHEPPIASVLPDADWWYAFYDELYDLYRSQGPKAARQIFKSRLGLGDLPRPPEGTEIPVEFTDMVARIRANQPFWWEYEIRNYPAVPLDIPALTKLSDRLLMGGGTTSRDLHPYQCSRAVAELTGAALAEFPGGHVGYMEFPAEFAEALQSQLPG